LLGRSGQNAPVVSGFENDPQLVGTWPSVDFVSDINDFQAGAKRRRGELFLKEVDPSCSPPMTPKPLLLPSKRKPEHNAKKRMV
jgi:hypothetical protein